MREFNNAIQQLAADYPSTMRGLTHIGSQDFSQTLNPGEEDVLAYAYPDGPNRGIYVGDEAFADNQARAEDGADEEDTGFTVPGGGSSEGVFTHEFGHQLGEQLLNNPQALADLNQAVANALGVPSYDATQPHDADTVQRVEDALSGYGSSDSHEMMAEAFTEYRLAPNPRPLAQAIGQVMDSYLGANATNNNASPSGTTNTPGTGTSNTTGTPSATGTPGNTPDASGNATPGGTTNTPGTGTTGTPSGTTNTPATGTPNTPGTGTPDTSGNTTPTGTTNTPGTGTPDGTTNAPGTDSSDGTTGNPDGQSGTPSGPHARDGESTPSGDGNRTSEAGTPPRPDTDTGTRTEPGDGNRARPPGPFDGGGTIRTDSDGDSSTRPRDETPPPGNTRDEPPPPTRDETPGNDRPDVRHDRTSDADPSRADDSDGTSPRRDVPEGLPDRLHDAWRNSDDTPAGRSLYGPDEPFMRDTARGVRPDPDGRFVLDANADRDGLYSGDRRLTPSDVADLIRNDPNWNGRDVVLLANQTGDGRFATELAQQLGVRVVAPQGAVDINALGNPEANGWTAVDRDGGPLDTGPQRFTTNEAGEQYGENRLSHVYTGLDPQLQNALYQYTVQSMQNAFLRPNAPDVGAHFDRLAADRRTADQLWALSRQLEPTVADVQRMRNEFQLDPHRQAVVDYVLGSPDPLGTFNNLMRTDPANAAMLRDLSTYLRPTAADLPRIQANPNLDPSQRALVDSLRNDPNAPAIVNGIVNNGGYHQFLEGYFGERPSVDAFNSRLDELDQALDQPLPEPVQTERGLHDVSFMTAADGSPLGARDASQLIGSVQHEHAFMSTSLGRDPAVVDNNPFPIRIHIDLPEGARGVWMGQQSAYSDQRELILPRNTRYEITHVDTNARDADGNPITEIRATVLLEGPHASPSADPARTPTSPPRADRLVAPDSGTTPPPPGSGGPLPRRAMPDDGAMPRSAANGTPADGTPARPDATPPRADSPGDDGTATRSSDDMPGTDRNDSDGTPPRDGETGETPPAGLPHDLHDVYRGSQETPAGRAFYAPGDDAMRDLASRVPADPNRFVVDGHGDADGMRVGDRRLSADEVADLIRNDPNWDGREIMLISCETGDGDFAAQLAQSLGVPVTAPNGLAWSNNDGSVYASSGHRDSEGRLRPDQPPNGGWNTYRPNGDVAPSGRDGFAPGHPVAGTDAASARGDDGAASRGTPQQHPWDPPQVTRDDSGASDRELPPDERAVDQTFPRQEARYRITTPGPDGQPIVRSIVYTNADGQVTHITNPQAEGLPGALTNPNENIDLTQPEPGVVHQIDFDQGDPHVFVAGDDRTSTPAAPFDPPRHLVEETVEGFNPRGRPFSTRQDLPENARIAVYDNQTPARLHGVFWTNDRGEITHVRTWYGDENKVANYNRELGLSANRNAGVPLPNVSYMVEPRSSFRAPEDGNLDPSPAVRRGDLGALVETDGTETPDAPVSSGDDDTRTPEYDYEVPAGTFLYHTDGNGQTDASTGRPRYQLDTPWERYENLQRTVLRLGLAEYPHVIVEFDGGHVNGHQAHSPRERINYFPQWRVENQANYPPGQNDASWHSLENRLARIDADPDNQIRIDRFEFFAESNRNNTGGLAYTPRVIHARWSQTDFSKIPPVTSYHYRSFYNLPEQDTRPGPDPLMPNNPGRTPRAPFGWREQAPLTDPDIQAMLNQADPRLREDLADLLQHFLPEHPDLARILTGQGTNTAETDLRNRLLNDPETLREVLNDPALTEVVEQAVLNDGGQNLDGIVDSVRRQSDDAADAPDGTARNAADEVGNGSAERGETDAPRFRRSDSTPEAESSPSPSLGDGAAARSTQEPDANAPGDGDPDGPAPDRRTPDDAAHRIHEDPRIREMLDRVANSDSELHAALQTQLRDVLPNHPLLVRIFSDDSPSVLDQAIRDSLLARPKTLHNLLKHPEALRILNDSADRVTREGPESVLGANKEKAQPTPLTEAQTQTSEDIAEDVRDRRRDGEPNEATKAPRQLDFDPPESFRSIDISNDPEAARRHPYLNAYLDGLYSAMRESVPLLHDLVNDPRIRELGGDPHMRPTEKDRDRALDKIIEDYRGDADRLNDLLGAKIQFGTVDELYRALADIQEIARSHGIEVTSIKDRMQNPVPSGYRDVQLTIRTPNGHIGELRFHLTSIDDVAAYEHSLYELRRDLPVVASESQRPFTREEEALDRAIQQRVISRFGAALERALTPPPTGHPTDRTPPSNERPDSASRYGWYENTQTTPQGDGQAGRDHDDQAPSSRADGPTTDSVHSDLPPHLHDLYRDSEATPAGRSFFGTDEPAMRDLARRVTPMPDTFVVDGHGDADGMRVNGRRLSVDDMAALIRNDPNWDGRQVMLLSCRTGEGDFAAQLAQRLGVPVTAPTGYAWSNNDGSVYASSGHRDAEGLLRPTIPPDGAWNTHHPDGTRSPAGDGGHLTGRPDDAASSSDDSAAARATDPPPGGAPSASDPLPGRVEDGFRRFDNNRDGFRYGEDHLGQVFHNLPPEQREAVLEYTRHSWPYNGLLRPDGVLDMAQVQDSLAAWHGHVFEGWALYEMTGGRVPTMDDIYDAIGRPDLTPVQERLIEDIVDSSDPDDALDYLIRAGAGARGMITATFGGWPTPEEFAQRVALMDAALDQPLPEAIEIQRGLQDVNFIPEFDPADIDSLLGARWTEPAFSSSALGKVPPEIDGQKPNVYVHLEVPAGTRGLWMGSQSIYPNQREIILARPLTYEINDVRQFGSKIHLYARVIPSGS
ncbi:ADP-ribosyltransferase [Actinomadura algeriensis]|uniref:ADP ribosyltransferase domain-containing protein n=1 Tax=Actinomadura algeriensis TaxID=1679523 RepID=A0ABR9JS13_9ACTN|nr:ADP-ribosyltransferase [Actinomadura algeriensis]MBE1533364.1 hypothetical protein [Actinomadura algeriensis]